MFPMHVYFLQTNLLKNNAIIQIIEVNILKYPTQSCVTKWLKEKLIFELIFWIVVLNYCSELLFWVSVKKNGEVQVLPQNKSYILSIKDYSMMVATRPEPTVLPPSRSDLVVFRNLFVTVLPFFDSYYGYFTYYLAFFRGKCIGFVSR